MAARSLAEFVQWLASAPAGTTLSAASVHATLAPLVDAPAGPTSPVGASWRERLWIAPPETRLGVREVAEALGRPRSWVYRHTGRKCGRALLPHRKFEGELVFLAGELRAWLASPAGQGHQATTPPLRPPTRARPLRAIS